MRNPAEGKNAVPMRDPKNAVPLRTARGNANADAKEVLDNFMNAPANLKRKSETKAATAAAAQAAAKQRRIEHAQPLPRVVEVKSKIDHQNKLATSSRRPAGPAASREAPSSSASARARASSSAVAAKDVTPLSSAGKVGQSFGQEPHSRASSSFAPSPCGSVRSTATSAETLREQLQQQMDDNAELTESLEKIRKTEFAALQKAEGLRLELEREKAAKEAEAAERQRAEEELATIRAQLQAAQAAAATQAEVESSLRNEKAALERTVADRDAEVARLAERGRAQEELRRTMHETISELRGNIRIFCRVRPPDRGGATSKSLVRVPSNQVEPTALELLPVEGAAQAGPAASNNANAKGAKFKFDRVFGEASSQEDVFREVSQLTQSALDGHRVCIFAYGQTGSGKTFTMEGASGDHRGVVPRAAQQVFDAARDLQSLGWTYEFEASCLEIYNEELRDLLPGPSTKLKISDANGVVTVPGLRSAKIVDAASLEALLNAASKVRSTAATKCNEQSSRSHYLFRMRLKGRNATTQESVDGELNLIDLAGSERTKESGVSGDAMREANAINKSLSSLGDVISAMGKRQDASGKTPMHVPYRNSKLTHVLQNALSGSAKTLMFVNINPGSHAESLSSLRFASKVGNVEVGPAQANRGRAQ